MSETIDAVRLRIAEGLVLDFGGLFGETPPKNTPSQSPVEPFSEGGEYNKPTSEETPVEGLTGLYTGISEKGAEQIPARGLLHQIQREKEAHQRSLEAYATYQDNRSKSNQLQSEILKGTRAGEDIYSLFLKAVEAISRMTSNSCFLSQIEADLKSIYGEGLRKSPPLKIELERVQKRLQRLYEAEKLELEPDSKQRVRAAIKAHRDRITELEALIAQAELEQANTEALP